MKRKKLSIAGLTNKVATRLQLLRRIQCSDDYGFCVCITCGVEKHYTEMHGGHFIERGRAATKLEPQNIWAQCAGCNLFGMKKASVVLDYEAALREIDPGLPDRLRQMSRGVKKYTRTELEEMLYDINNQIREAEDRIHHNARG